MTRIRPIETALALALLVAAGSPRLFSQEPKDDAKPAATPAARRPADPSRRVPNHFGQVGLTPEQRESIYKIRKTSYEKIEALRAQVAEAEAKSMADCEAVLTETQRKLLENLRAGGGRATRTTTADTAKAAK